MSDLEYQPLIHDHAAFLARAHERSGFQEAYDALESEYQRFGGILLTRAGDGASRSAHQEGGDDGGGAVADDT